MYAHATIFAPVVHKEFAEIEETFRGWQRL